MPLSSAHNIFFFTIFSQFLILFLWFLPPKVISKTWCFFGVSQAKAFHGAKRTSNSSSWLKSTWAGSSQGSWITHFVSMSSSKYKNWNLQYRHFLVIYPTSWQQRRGISKMATPCQIIHIMYSLLTQFVWSGRSPGRAVPWMIIHVFSCFALNQAISSDLLWVGSWFQLRKTRLFV
jgi:hypothetical protein